jgi:PD-(D/E)XK endonuclease
LKKEDNLKNSGPNRLGMNIRHPKQRGEWVEFEFMARVAELGFTFDRPAGGCALHDIAIDLVDRLVRVQIKSTTCLQEYRLHAKKEENRTSKANRATFCAELRPHTRSRPYRLSDFEYLAFYVVPRDIWYIIPSFVALQTGTVCVRPGDKENRFERYREAWHLLHHPAPDDPGSPETFLIFGSAEEFHHS